VDIVVAFLVWRRRFYSIRQISRSTTPNAAESGGIYRQSIDYAAPPPGNAFSFLVSNPMRNVLLHAILEHGKA